MFQVLFRRALAGAATMLVVLALTSTPALADSGSYTADGGESCSWYGSGMSYSISCSGYNRRAGGYVNYNCDLSIYGSGSSSWRCRSSNGATWSGSN